nr:hypothetical protein [Tanacetum cinerariifolium]
MIYSEIRHLFEKHFNYNQAFLEEVNEEVTLPEKEVEVKAHKREGESLKKKVTKKQKMDEEAKDFISHLQIIANDDDDVYTEATPLASKILVVDYKIHFERNKPYFKIIRADDPKETTSTVVMHSKVQSKDKEKGILIEEPKPLKGKARIEQDEAFARQLEAELNADINWNAVMEQVTRSERMNDAVMKYQAFKRKPLTKAQARKNMIIYLKNMAGFKIN